MAYLHPTAAGVSKLAKAFVFAIFLLAGFAACPRPSFAQDRSTQTFLVQFEPQSTPAERDAWLAAAGGELVAWLPQIGVAEVAFPRREISAAATAGGPVAYLEPDAAVSGDLAVSDPAYMDVNQGYGQHLLGLDGAWSITRGSADVVIAIVDSGVNPIHPEFEDRLVPGYDFINKDADPADDHGHGTHVAGIAAAGINGVGTVGVCPECKIMPVKVLNERNGGTWSSVSKGILFAVDNGADVINLSLGATVSSTTLISAVQYALDHNVVVIAAAGNGANNAPFYPAAAPGVIGVSGTDAGDNFWPVSNYGNFVDVAAPGVNIYSSYYSIANGPGYAYMSGTSMASPFVTGLAALIRSRQPALSAAEVAGLLGSTAKDLGDGGWDRYYGFGRVDAHAALVAANGGVDPATPADPALPAVPDPTRAFAVYLPNISRK